MLTRTGMCGVVVLSLLLSAETKGEDPMEEQQELYGICDEYHDYAIAARDECWAAATAAGNALTAYTAASKTHLTPGEASSSSAVAADAAVYYATAQTEEYDALAYLTQANAAHMDGESRWNTGQYAAACVFFEDAIDLYSTWAECEFQMAEGDYDYAAMYWGEAKGTVTEALTDPNCLCCFNPDAECDCGD